METEEKIVDDGPWRATRLWNSIIRNLQEGIPQKKHRRNLKTYEKCFTGIEATDWLHKHLKKNPNFDAEVSKEQTILLLQKLVRAGVIVPITLETIQSISGAFHQYSQNLQNVGGDSSTSPSNNTNHIFRSNTDLYRLASDAVEQLRTPGKEPMKKHKYQKRGEENSHKNTSSHRTPLSQLQNNKNDTVGVDSTAVTSTARNFRSSFRRNKNKLKQKALNFKENEDELYSSNIIEGRDSKENEENSYSADHRKNLNLSYLQSLPPNSLVVLDNDSTWKEIFTSQLKLTLSDVHVRGLNISTTNIIFNMTNVSPKGVVQLKSIASSTSPTKENNTTYLQQHDLPHWTLSAMKCLANWPKQIKSHECNEADGATFPSYPGFEQDVFEVVKDYFVGQMNKQGPLTTYKLFDIFVSAYIKAEAIGARSKVAKSESQKNILNSHRIPQQYHFQHLNGYYAETDLDSGCYVQTSTPSSSVDKVVVHGRDNVPKSSNYGASSFFQMDKSKVWPESEYGLSTTNLKRVAKIRQTYEFCPDVVSNVSKRRDIKPIVNNPNHEFNNSPVPLNSEMSATAIMRNFLPPNTCFETAFMNECPVTRIVPQKRSETLHHFEHSKDEVATQRTSSQNCRRLKCYTPIPSGGSINGNAWDTRSIATQTEDEDDERIPFAGKESKSRSRQPRWKRSVRKRKSIAIMETARNPISNHPSSPAKSENGILSSGRVNRGFSISPQRHNQCNGNIPLIQRSASTVPYSFMASNVAQNNQVYSNSLDNLLSNQHDRYSVVVDATSDRQQYETISPSENMIRSKTVRAEKRKQKDRRGRSVERFVESCQYDLNDKMTYPEGRHIHPTMYDNRPKSMAVNENRFCYENPLHTVDDTSRVMTRQPSSNSNAYYSSPNTSNSKSSTSSLSGSASNYQHRSRRFRPSRPSYSNEHHELFHHQNGLSVKTPLRSCPSLLNTDHIPFMDDSNMLYARAEPYQPSLSSEQELESINSKLMSNEGITSAISSFQLLGLLIPPPNRRKLQLLLKFMRRLASKDKLKLMGSSYLGCTSKDGYKKCKDIVLDVFTETIIKPNQDYSNGDMELSRKIVQFFMDHYEDVWTPPAKLRKEVEERVYQSLVSKRLEAGEDPFPITFCKRVPSKIYEKQKQGQALEQAMLNLLEQILFDVKMNMKEKKKKVKKFKESYPDVYKMRFPTEESEPDYMQANESKPITRMSSLAKLKNAIRL